MSRSLSSRKERQSPSPATILTNTGKPADMLARFEQFVRGMHDSRELLDWLPKITGDQRNLRVAWDRLVREGGQAPGPNGITYSDVPREMIWPLLRDIKARLLDGSYRPGPVRLVEIPKSSGEGTRTLSIPNIEDRIVQRGIQQIASPLLEPSFLPDSFGGRPGCNTWQALTRALPLIEEGHTVLISQDIRNAFDNVPLRRLLDVLRRRIPSPQFVSMVENAVVGSRRTGLHQGSPLSPLLMNLHLDHFLDRPWRRLHPSMPLLRYVDDLLILCRPGDADPATIHDDLMELLTPNSMPLKRAREDAICDLHQRPCVWLGYELSLGDRGPVVVRPAQWLGELEESLMRAHAEDNSPVRAELALRGVIEYAAPCYPFADRKAVYEAVQNLCVEMGFEEIVPDNRVFNYHWKRASQRWCEAAERHGYLVARPKRTKKVPLPRRSTQLSQQNGAPF
jgi:retron-type reverse transcriptase